MDIAGEVRRLRSIALVLLLWGPAGGGEEVGAACGQSADKTAGSVGISGGLCVAIGAKDTAFAAGLAETGRFLVHVLDPAPKTVDEARRRLGGQGRYGLVSVDRLDAAGKLPYTENLVNLLVILTGDILPGEAYRVVCPMGAVLAAPGTMTAAQLRQAGFEGIGPVEAAQGWQGGRKPRLALMDEWSHPRHSASGNAVSQDVLVGPPQRIRWVAWGHLDDHEGEISAGGRNFYRAGLARHPFDGLPQWHREHILVARDAFNGLRLWHRKDMARYSASARHVFAATKHGPLALDAATGETVREYKAAGGYPAGMFHDGGTLIVFQRYGAAVWAFDVETARLLWSFKASKPRGVVVGDDLVAFVQGDSRWDHSWAPRAGGKNELVVLDRTTGQVRWRRDDHPWLGDVADLVYYRGMLACEISTLADEGAGNAVKLVSASDGRLLLNHEFVPAMGHAKTARAMFIGDRFWVLHLGPPDEKNQPRAQVSAIDLTAGKVLATYDAAMNNCYPPVATPRYIICGRLDLTDLRTGQVTSCPITKGGCGGSRGWVPANGLLYVRPNHCACWPMLRGYAALAPGRAGGDGITKLDAANFMIERGVDPPPGVPSVRDEESWPSYRRDAWRSGSTPAGGPTELKTLWSVGLGAKDATGPISEDWRENPFVRGLVTAPVVAGGLVYVACPDAHELVALDARGGQVRWRFVANGRVDTPPTIHRGLCLFGSRSGWVYCLRADDGRLVWRLRAAPLDERIVAHGQLESPWPVPGSVLVVEDVAYFAAGRHPLADGGILVFAVEPSIGRILWVKRLHGLPSGLFGLDFDSFDLLFREDGGVAMSRWVFDRATGTVTAKPRDAFARLYTGKAAVVVPRGHWSYGPKEVMRRGPDTRGQSLVVFRDNMLLGCVPGKRAVYRRDFNLEGGEKFDPLWYGQGGQGWPSERLVSKTTWKVEVFDEKAKQMIVAMVLANDRLYLAGSGGELQVRSAADGSLLAKGALPEAVWDGMAVVGGQLFVSTRDGQVFCLGGG